MSTRRIIIAIVLALLAFLGIYTWNQRTGQWDWLAANTGLEIAGGVLRAVHGVGDSIGAVWKRYLALIDVQEENDRLRDEVARLHQELIASRESQAELERLRGLLRLEVPQGWSVVGARVLASRIGPNASLETLLLAQGYLDGAAPGTAVAGREGLVGRVYKAGPGTSMVLLLSDVGSRVAVVAARSRVQGILAGGGAGNLMEMRFVKQNAPLEEGELLLTSGLDAAYPKGIPVARVRSVKAGPAPTLEVTAEPLVHFGALEEVLLYERPAGLFMPEAGDVYVRSPRDIVSEAPRYAAPAE